MSDEPYPPPTPHTSLLPSYSTHRVAQMGYPKVDRDKLFRARAIVVVTLFINVACLLFGTLVSPSIQSVAREVRHHCTGGRDFAAEPPPAPQNHYAFSPNPWFIIAFFAAHVVLQLWWILRLFHATEDTAARLDALSYVPIYALGSIALGPFPLPFFPSRTRSPRAPHSRLGAPLDARPLRARVRARRAQLRRAPAPARNAPARDAREPLHAPRREDVRGARAHALPRHGRGRARPARAAVDARGRARGRALRHLRASLPRSSLLGLDAGADGG